MFWAMVVASTIVAYSLVDAVGTTLCPTPLYLFGMVVVQWVCWIPWLICSSKLRSDIARAFSPKAQGGFRLETCFFAVFAP